VRQLERWRFGVIDCQMRTAHLASLGAREISRAAFVGMVRTLVAEPAVPVPWRFDGE
jgi:leucyl/phenylalanyl-tRNA--protein transferase